MGVSAKSGSAISIPAIDLFMEISEFEIDGKPNYTLRTTVMGKRNVQAVTNFQDLMRHIEANLVLQKLSGK